MDVATAIKERRSGHQYAEGREITDEQLERLFELVKLSPSGYNLQPWEFIVVRSKEGKEKLKALAYNQEQITKSAATVIVAGTLKPSEFAPRNFASWVKNGYFSEDVAAKTIERVKSMEQDREAMKVWSARSTSLACMTLMLAAKEMGITTGPMEGFDFEGVQKAFGIPVHYYPVMLITLGYNAKPELPRNIRRPWNEIVHLEKFGEHPT